ncbi:MAG TPA: SpoIVB peptidase S55 domain-containing protein [Polyangiaceae bacterium]|nr:SpoIVB peptidase S55 domain-containing protein [Polyangiaceae bacterium]
MRPSSLVAWAALSGVLLPLAVGLSVARADGFASRPDIIPVDQIKKGMKGYGLTVFEGTKPEKFDVEVIDVLRNFRPHQELILVKTIHPRLAIAKVVAGMSGSPIYLDGKMAGAYAYGWTFGSEPVAGVTPIRSMLDDLDRPLPKLIDGWKLELSPGLAAKGTNGKTAGAFPGLSGQRFAGQLEKYDVFGHAASLGKANAISTSGETAVLKPVATPLLVGGMTSAAVSVAKDLLSPLGLEPMEAGGGGDRDEADAPTRFVDGGAIGVQLVRGDMSAMGLGTVTRVEGDKLVAFGHPMMESGVTALPTAIGRVLWFLASDYRSFKLGMPVRSVGALVNDRQASIVVSHSAKAPTIPVSISIKGVPGARFTDWHFEIAHEKFMSPSFMSVALGSAVQAIASDHQDVTWTAKSKLKIKGHGEIVLEDFGVAIGGTPDPREFAGSNLVRAVGAILNNPWEPAFIESAHMDIELKYARDVYRLRGVEALESEVDAGGTARLKLTLSPFAGPLVTKIVEVPLPKHLAGQTVQLSIRPGYAVDKERPAAETLTDLVSNLVDPVFPPKSIVVSYAGQNAVTYKGHVAENLPPGAFDAIRPTSATIAPEPYRAEVHQVIPLSEFMSGQDHVSIEVRPVLR